MGGAPSLILPGILLGGMDVIEDPTFFTKNDITWVLSLGRDAPPPRIKLAGREHINVPDTPQSDLGSHFSTIVRFIASGRHLQHRCVYVHCAAGISRSTTSLCAYLMTHLDLTFSLALAFVSTRRKAVCPNEGFCQQLRKFEASSLRTQLALEMRRQCPDYEALRQRDLGEVVAAMRTDVVRPIGPRDVERDARRSALRVLRNSAAEQPGAAGLSLGTGEGHGDVGLSWLVRDERSRTNRSRTGRSSRDAPGSLGADEQNCVHPQSTEPTKLGAARRFWGRLWVW